MLIHTCSVILLLAKFTSFTGAVTTQVCTKRRVQSFTPAEPKINGSAREFAEFIHTQQIWADKSLLIDSIVKQKERVTFISSPRGWGRSSNLRMLQAFFTIITDDQGVKVPLNKTYSYSYFQKGLLYLNDDEIRRIHPAPLIKQHQDVLNQTLGQFPVIYMNFGPVKFSAVVDSVKHLIGEAYKSYSYIVDNVGAHQKISSDLRDRVKKCFELTKDSSSNAITDELLKGIQTLSELLHVFYEKKVVILIDEYDMFVQKLYFSLYKDFDQGVESTVNDFYKKFTQYSFLSNEFLEKAVITGVLPVSEILGFGTNEVRKHNFISGDDIYTFYGFTSTEVPEMLKFHHVENSTDGVTKWYGGYSCPNSTSGHIFPPISVTYFLKAKELDNYLTKSVSVEFMFKLRRYALFVNTLKSLLNNGTYDMEYSKIENLTNQDCRTLNNLVKGDFVETNFQKVQCDLALTFLCSTGYLTVDRTFANSGKNSTHIRLKIPNEEIANDIKRRVEQTENTAETTTEIAKH